MQCIKCKTILILDKNITNSRLNKKYYICNSCKKELDAINYQKQKKHRLFKAKENYYKNSDKKKDYQKQYHIKNRDKILSKWKKERLENKNTRFCVICDNMITKEEKINKIYCSNKCRTSAWDKKNKKYLNIKKAEYKKNRYSNDIIFNLKERCRSRTRAFFKWKGKTKSKTTEELLGCDWETLKIHIECQFVDGMNWDNRDLWHIDHIIPISSAETEKEVYVLSNYKNLQPLWAEDNLKKGSKHL